MRAFIAVDLPPITVESHPVGSAGAGSHLTLMFLGEVAEALVPALSEGCRAVARRHAPFELRLEGMGAFPSVERPRVVWIGIGAPGSEELTRLHADLVPMLQELRVPLEDRPFVPHVTLLRVRGRVGPHEARGLVDRHRTDFFERTPVTEITLKSSELGPDGATHRTLARAPLGVPPA